MIPAIQVHEWAQRLAPLQLSLMVVAAVVASSVFCGLLLARRGLLRSLPGLFYLLSGVGALHLAASSRSASWPSRILLLLAALCWGAHLMMARRAAGFVDGSGRAQSAASEDSEAEAAPVSAHAGTASQGVGAVVAVGGGLGLSRRARRIFFGLAFVVAAILLFDDLGGYAGTLVAWEAPVVSVGFGEALVQGISPLDFARQRLFWDNGVLSRGDTSLFYGPPTYLLIHLFGLSTWTLRLMSAVATLLAMWAMYGLGRTLFSANVGVAAALFFGLNSTVLLYGRYGSSIAATLLAVVLALWACWRFLESPRSAWWLGGCCAVALFVATLHYAPARIVVLYLLAVLPCAVLFDRRLRCWQTIFGLLVIGAAIVAVLRFESSYEQNFLRARGEQYFAMLGNPKSIEPLVGIDVSDMNIAHLDWRDRFTFLARLLRRTVPQYLDLIAPNVSPRPGGHVVRSDPPPMPLAYAPVHLLIVLGIGFSLLRWRSPLHLSLLLLPVCFAAPLLLTNRVDAHRASLLVLPLSIWAALGCREVARLLRQTRTPRSLQLFLAVLFLASVVFADIHLRYFSSPPTVITGKAMVAKFSEIPGSIFLGLLYDHRVRAWLDMHLIERRRRDPDDNSVLLPEAIVQGLRADLGGPRGLSIRQVVRLAEQGTVLLGPRSKFSGAVAQLQARGLRVGGDDAARFPLLRVDSGAQRTGVADGEFPILPVIPVAPQPKAPRLAPGPRRYLSTMRPLKTEYGFQPPRMNRTWEGGRVRMGGVLYSRAIGTHAWTKMTYAVPDDAVAFQAIIGLSDIVTECESASVVFEVQGDGSALFSSGIIDPATPPRSLAVSVERVEKLTLLVTDAGDGRDCDHANWADPAFVLEPNAAAPGRH